MANYHRAKVDCVSVDYTYPVQITAMWRATAQCGKYVDVVVSSDVPKEIIPFVVRRIIDDPSCPEYREIIKRLDTKPANVQRFLASAVQELLDALQDNVHMEHVNVVFNGDKLHFNWKVKNLETGESAPVKLSSSPGKEITMDQFMKTNKPLSSKGLDLTKRDIRKMFVIVKKIIKMFPRISTKNTPLRGLYVSPSQTRKEA